MTEAQFELLTNTATLLMLGGLLCALLKRTALAALLVVAGLALPVASIIAVEHGPQVKAVLVEWLSGQQQTDWTNSTGAAIRSRFSELWAQLPTQYRLASTVFGVFAALLLVLLSAVFILRWVSRPFLGASAADAMGATLAADGVRFILGGFLIRLIRWATQSLGRHP